MTTLTIKFDIPDINIRLHSHTVDDDRILQSIEALRSLFMTSKQEFSDQLDALKTQLDEAKATNEKTKGEVVAAVDANTANVAALNQQIADLQAIIAAGGDDVPSEIVEKFNAVKASADAVSVSSKALDDLNEDAP